MSRKVFKVPNFHGGIDEISSPIDLKEGFFPDLTDVMVDRLGQVVPMGDFDVAPTHNPSAYSFMPDASPGYGLYAFASNRKLDGALGDCVIYVIQNFVVDKYGSTFKFWDNVTNSWAPMGSFDLEASGKTIANYYLPDYFVYNGVLRICDGNFSNITQGVALDPDTERGWVGYIENYRFKGTSPSGIPDTTTAWEKHTDPFLLPPTRGICGSKVVSYSGETTATTLEETEIGTTTNVSGVEGATVNTGYAAEMVGHLAISTNDVSGDTAPPITVVANDSLTVAIGGGSIGGGVYHLYPPIGTGVNLDITASNVGGFLPDVGAIDGSTPGYRVGSTWIYDGHQESTIYEMPIGWCANRGDDDVATNNAADIAGLNIVGDNSSTGVFDGILTVAGHMNSRITGCRIYCTHADDPSDNWFLMWDVDFNQGARTSMTTDTWTYNSAAVPFTLDIEHGDTNDNYLWIELPTFRGPIGETTYFTLNGHGPTEDLDIRYKTSAVVNGLIYVGNVVKSVDGRTQSFPDRIWYSAFNTFASSPSPDSFPEGNWLQNTAVSGDPIVKLLGMGNQLLSFGSTYLTVWTITPSGEVVTGTFPGYGIDKPCQAIRTPNGVVFANRSGVFLYDGQGVTPLLHKRGSA